MKILILIAMLFFHIIDDYYLQGILASMKQKSWWEKNAPDELYDHDYIMALYEHAFSWTVMIHIPCIFYQIFLNDSSVSSFHYLFTFIVMIVIHALVDNAKANKKTINLIQDQLCHILQVFYLWFYYCFMY